MGDQADEAREAEERDPRWQPEDIGGAVDQGEAERASRARSMDATVRGIPMTIAEFRAAQKARVDAANTMEELLILALASVKHDAKEGVMLAGYLVDKIVKVLEVGVRDPWFRLGTWISGMDDGGVVVSRKVGIGRKEDQEEWSVMMEFGHEAPDSPMVGGAAYGIGDTLNEALEQALKDVRA